MIATTHFDSPLIATTIPSKTASQRAMRTRRARSQRLVGEVSASITECSCNTRSNVPRGCREPGAAAPRQVPLRLRRLRAMEKEAVDRGTGAAHVCAERAERAQLVGER